MHDYTDTSKPNNGDSIESNRDEYYLQYKLYYLLGASFFVFTGILDVFQYYDVLNVPMMFAGVAGVISSLSQTSQQEDMRDKHVSTFILIGVIYVIASTPFIWRVNTFILNWGCMFLNWGDI